MEDCFFEKKLDNASLSTHARDAERVPCMGAYEFIEFFGKVRIFKDTKLLKPTLSASTSVDESVRSLAAYVRATRATSWSAALCTDAKSTLMALIFIWVVFKKTGVSGGSTL